MVLLAVVMREREESKMILGFLIFSMRCEAINKRKGVSKEQVWIDKEEFGFGYAEIKSSVNM